MPNSCFSDLSDTLNLLNSVIPVPFRENSIEPAACVWLETEWVLVNGYASIRQAEWSLWSTVIASGAEVSVSLWVPLINPRSTKSTHSFKSKKKSLSNNCTI